MAKITMVFEDHQNFDGLTFDIASDPAMPGLGQPHTPAQTAVLLAHHAVVTFIERLGGESHSVDLDDLDDVPTTDGERDHDR